MPDTNDKHTSEPGVPDDGRMTSSGTLRGRHFAIIVIVALAIGAVLYIWHWSSKRLPSGRPERVAVVPEGSRAVTLYFADKSAETLLTETRLVAIGTEFVEQVGQVIVALLAGPHEEGVSTVADGTRLLNVFYDPETSTVYLDFSSELVAGHPGGGAAEYYTITALLRTISENFPEVRAVQILVEGLQVGTIAGHIDAYSPFLVRDWR